MAASLFAPGEIVDGKYRIVRQIGEGGMGAVFEAEAMRIHRRVAIKVLRADSVHDGEVAARFQLEAQAAGRIGSRHIVEVLDLGQLGSGAPYMVMEFLEGESLRGRIATQAPMQVEALATIADQLLAGVGAAHAAGVIHRDLKPDNVFLVKQGRGGDFVKLLDFGISKFDTGKDMRLTRTGALMGTPYYLAPEQANGSKALDHRTDLYTVGVILYECLTGAVPFSGETINKLLFQIVLEPPTPVRQRAPNADPEFIALVEKAMSKDPAQRFQSAEEMRVALERWNGAGAATMEAQSFGRTPGSSQVPRSSAVPTPASTKRSPSIEPPPPTLQSANGASQRWTQNGTPLGLDIEVDPGVPRKKAKPLLWFLTLVLASLATVTVVALMRDTTDSRVTAASASAPLEAPPNGPAPAASPAPALAAEPSVNIAAPSLPSLPSSEASATPGRTAPAAPAGRSTRGSAVRPATPVPVVPAPAPPEPTPVAVPAPAPAPPPPPPPAAATPAPAPDSDVSRMKGGRPIRGDL